MAREKINNTENKTKSVESADTMENAEAMETTESVGNAVEKEKQVEPDFNDIDNTEPDGRSLEEQAEAEMAAETKEQEKQASASRSAERKGRTRKQASTKISENDIITIHKNSPSVNLSSEKEERMHELQNSRITRKVLTGILSSIEKMHISEDQTMQVAIVDYGGIRVMIPLPEMNIVINKPNSESSKDSVATRQIKIASNMIGCEVDFVVSGIQDNKVAASRKEAMKKKMQDFYLPQDGNEPVLIPGKAAEARVIAVAENALRLEVFGVECFVRVLDMSAAWMPDARDKYSVGDIVPVRIVNVNINNDTVSSIEVEGKSFELAEQTEETVCTQGSRYLGIVTGSNDGTYFVRLNGVNAIAHTCQAQGPKPGKKDQVAFVCTRMDVESHVAIGIITKVIKRAKI